MWYLDKYVCITSTFLIHAWGPLLVSSSEDSICAPVLPVNWPGMEFDWAQASIYKTKINVRPKQRLCTFCHNYFLLLLNSFHMILHLCLVVCSLPLTSMQTSKNWVSFYINSKTWTLSLASLWFNISTIKGKLNTFFFFLSMCPLVELPKNVPKLYRHVCTNRKCKCYKE